MPVYVCPKCGWRVEKPEGSYYHKKCGEDALMLTEEEFLAKKREAADRLMDVRASITIILEDLRMELPVVYGKVEKPIEDVREKLIEAEKQLRK